MSQRVADLERERDELRANLHDTESRLRDALTLARNYGMQAEEQGRWWREAKAQLQASELRCAALEGALRTFCAHFSPDLDPLYSYPAHVGADLIIEARALLAPASPAPAMTEANYGLRPGPWVCPTCGDPECG